MTDLEYAIDFAIHESKREADRMKRSSSFSAMEINPRRDRVEAFLRTLERSGYRVVPR